MPAVRALATHVHVTTLTGVLPVVVVIFIVIIIIAGDGGINDGAGNIHGAFDHIARNADGGANHRASGAYNSADNAAR